MKRSIFLLIIGLTLLATRIQAQEAVYNHPELEWFTIKTDHFQVHYHRGAERTAKEVALIAERIYKPITELYGYKKNETFHFIIRDHDDYSNGAAYYFDNKVEIWATPMDFDLRGTHPWLLNVVTHEFTHMISLDLSKRFGEHIPALYIQYWGYEKEKRPDVLRGFPNRIVSYPIAGSSIPPWFAEGLSQFQAPNVAFDFWDTHRDMILRMAVLKDRMLSYDEMSSFGHTSLGNEMVYNAGFAFVSYIAKFYGANRLRRLAEAMKSPLRLSFDSAIRSVLGKSGQQLYDEWRHYLTETYTRGVQEIRSREVTGRILQKKGFANLYPVWSPDGSKIAYLSNQGQDYLGLTTLYLYDLETGKEKAIKGNVQSPATFSPDGRFLIYARKKQVGASGSKYFDLFRYDLQTGKEKQLTRGLRARAPSFSSKGNRVVCVVSRDGTDNLAILDITNNTMTQITTFRSGEQIFHPSFSPDEKLIVFDISRKRHGRDLAVVDNKGKNIRFLIQNQGDARTPVFHPQKNTVFFAWDRTGIFNVFSYDLHSGKSKQLTNVVGGAFMPAFHPEGGLAYSLYTEDGYKLAHIQSLQEIKDSNYLATSQLIRNKPVSRIPEITGNGDDDVSGADNHPGKAYRPTYGPLNLLPRLMIDYGTLKLGTYFFSSEVLDKYSVFGGFAINRQWDMDIFGIVQYRQFYPTIFLELYNQVQHTEEGIDKFRYSLKEADIGFELPFFSENTALRSMFVYSRYDGRIETMISGQEIKFSYTYMIGKSLALQFRHSNIAPKSDGTINPSGGRKISLRYDYQNNKFIDGFKLNQKYGTFVEVYKPYRYHQIELSWEEYIPLFWGHTLTLKTHSGYIDRPIDSFFNFFGGGIIGLKGYPFYSIEGRKLLNTSLVYRFPIAKNIDFSLLFLKLDRLYGALFADYGNAWDKGKPQWSEFKKDVGIQLRLQTFSFYNFPTQFFFDAAYGLDEVVNRNIHYGKEWRIYFGVAFDYID